MSKAQEIAAGLRKVMKKSEVAFLLGDSSFSSSCARFTSGSPSVDEALGGGVPVGKIIELYGPESSGKTSLSLAILANAQKEGMVAGIIDAEHALDPRWVEKFGGTPDELIVSQPGCAEEAFSVAENMIDLGVNVIVIDSVAALTPRAEIEGEFGDAQMGLQARLMGQALRKLKGKISSSKVTVIFINQLREKIGVMFGSPETTPGGKALKFYADIRIDIRRKDVLKDGDASIGILSRVKVVKNKTAAPFREGAFKLMFAGGLDASDDVISQAIKQGIIAKSGSWYQFKDTRSQGLPAFLKVLGAAGLAEIEEMIKNGEVPAVESSLNEAGETEEDYQWKEE
jgi:recombination protein RecA